MAIAHRLDGFRIGISRCFPQVPPARLRLVSGGHRGWNTETCFLGEDLVFQIPLTQEGHRCFELQRSLLPRLAPTLPVRIPDFSFYSPWCSSLSAPLAGYRRIHGSRLSAARLARMSRRARGRLAARLGRFLAALHAFPVATARELGVLYEVPDRVRWLAEVFHTRLEKHLSSRQRRQVRARLEAYREAVENPAGPLVVAHSDLMSDHLFVDSGGQLSGVIDWGNVTLAEPAAELGKMIFFFGREWVKEVLEFYPLPGEAAHRAVTIYAPAVPLDWLPHAVETGDRKLFQGAVTRLMARDLEVEV